MKNLLKLQNHLAILALSVSLFMLQGCYQLRVIPEHVSGSGVKKDTTIISYFWGINKKTFDVKRCQGNALAKVTINYNFGYSVVNLLTLGIVAPMKVGYECANDSPTGSIKVMDDSNMKTNKN
jgi:hypothetical protein